MPVIRIATRKSRLALWQAEHVASLLRAAHPGLEIEFNAMRTHGDRLLDAPLAKVGGKGLFVKQLEVALLQGGADIAVHSLKDMPVHLPQGLIMPVMLEREDPRDALVSRRGLRLDTLPEGARVGTSSLRRRCQLLALRPDLEVLDVRGGVDTRLSHLDEGRYDAIVLACAGLKRLDLDARIGEAIDPERFVPAVGQGVIAIECREADAATRALIAPLNDEVSALRARSERALNASLDGGCQVPIAAHAVVRGDELRMAALVASPDGAEVLRESGSSARDEGESLGQRLARRLLDRGARAILDAVYSES
ncbi:MAG: hydroxymethylbilane synthase [Gammaproteobacteria bacterium]